VFGRSNFRAAAAALSRTMARLLVINSDSELAGITEKLKGVESLEIESVPNFGRALARLEQKPFDALLTAMTTGVQEDLAFLQEARRFRPNIRAVCLAQSATPDELLAALRAQVYAVFSAPFEPDRIADLVIKALQDAATDDIDVLSASPNWITLRVRARLLTAERVVAFMDQLHGRLFDDSRRDDLLMAFREILLNAIEHGAGFDPEKEIVINAVRSKRALSFHFRDPGPGFATHRLPQAATEGDPISHMDYREEAGLRPGGFGLMVTRQLVDEVIYNEVGNEVLLVKHLDVQ
jgi:anti-sigma regulatory factor (Ser/Thr protein kinase)/CheY-like chemotaxis protein